uniref:Uncharacterized protein n=1 Tax=viral metagenome TaxID=1070528 RepID=A0A6M3J3N9_9ZZZZ
MTNDEHQAARVLASLLAGHTPEQIHRRRPEWSLLALRVAAHAVAVARLDLAASIAAAPVRPRAKSLRNGQA